MADFYSGGAHLCKKHGIEESGRGLFETLNVIAQNSSFPTIPVRAYLVSSYFCEQMLKPSLCFVGIFNSAVNQTLKRRNVFAVLVPQNINQLSQQGNRITHALVLFVDDCADLRVEEFLRIDGQLFLVKVDRTRVVSPLLRILFVVPELAKLSFHSRPQILREVLALLPMHTVTHLAGYLSNGL